MTNFLHILNYTAKKCNIVCATGQIYFCILDEFKMNFHGFSLFVNRNRILIIVVRELTYPLIN